MKLPKVIPVFPLSNFIIFPKTTVPLNIFEPRYIDMVNDTMKADKFIGMVQPNITKIFDDLKAPSLHKVGCLGKISDLQKSSDGRVLINLTGVTRFKILEEIKNNKLYREFKVDYKNYELDLKDVSEDHSTKSLMEKAKVFFKRNGLLLNWREFEKLDKTQKINIVATQTIINPNLTSESWKTLKYCLLEKGPKNVILEKAKSITNSRMNSPEIPNLSVLGISVPKVATIDMALKTEKKGSPVLNSSANAHPNVI